MNSLNYFRRFLFSMLLVSALASVSLFACNDHQKKAKKCPDAEEGILRDLSGLDGCGWVIQLADSSRLEPINLGDFNIELVNNKPVCIRYHERTDMGSICMVGKIVEIDFIE